MSLLSILKKSYYYYKLSNLGESIYQSRDLLEYITSPEDRDRITYNITEFNARGISLAFSTDTQRILEVSIINDLPMLSLGVCSVNISGMSPEFVIQTIVNSCEITSDNTGLGIGTLKINELGSLILYISIPLKWKDLSRKGLCKLALDVTNTANTIILPNLKKDIDDMLNFEAMVAENNVDDLGDPDGDYDRN